MTPKKKRRRNYRVSVVVVLALIGVIITLALLFPRMVTTLSGDFAKINVPLIKTQLKSANDGHDYTVQSLFTVEMDKNARTSISNEMLKDALTEITSELNVDQLMAEGGVRYMNEYVTDELNKKFAEVTDSKVYAYDLFIGDNIQLSEAEPDRNDVYKSLFNKLN